MRDDSERMTSMILPAVKTSGSLVRLHNQFTFENPTRQSPPGPDISIPRPLRRRKRSRAFANPWCRN
jgi:hypothetical protein